MKCAHCNHKINETNPFISIKWNDSIHNRGQPHTNIGELLYHADCFMVVAGENYVKALRDSYYGGTSAVDPDAQVQQTNPDDLKARMNYFKMIGDTSISYKK